MTTPALIVWTVVQDAQGRVLLARRCGSRFAAGLWNLPGGALEPGEDLRGAAFLFRAQVGQGEPRPLDKTDAVQWADPAQLLPGCQRPCGYTCSRERGSPSSGVRRRPRSGLSWMGKRQSESRTGRQRNGHCSRDHSDPA
ncbi:MAG: NUDIX hydrolase [Deinococcus sp.]|nr:NUDIX hydrolase [Deinococcus sp.]